MQVTIRMPSSLKKSIDDFTENADITSMEFIRRAITEKLIRETNSSNKTKIEYMDKDIFKKYLLEAIKCDEEIRREIKLIE